MLHRLVHDGLTRLVGERFECERVPDGLSRSEVFRVHTPYGSFALKSFEPQSGLEARILGIHEFQARLASNTQIRVPHLRTWVQGSTLLFDGERYWELAEWLVGSPLAISSPGVKMNWDSSIHAIAEFHLAAKRIRLVSHRSHGLEQRIRLLPRLRSEDFMIPSRFADDSFIAGIATSAHSLWRRATGTLMNRLTAIANARVTCHWIHGDLRREHVLFSNGFAPGFVDFAAARVDLPSFDLARYFEMLLVDGKSHFSDCVQRYNELTGNTIVADELVAVECASTLLAAANWLKWIGDSSLEVGGLGPAPLRRLSELSLKLRYFEGLACMQTRFG